MPKKYIPSPMSFEDFSKPHSYADLFETEPCSRCGGSGKFSFNLMDGDRCYGCNGGGVKFTRRGKRQFKAYIKNQEKPASEVKPGEKVKLDGYKNFALPVSIRKGHSSIRVGEAVVPLVEFFFSNTKVSIEENRIVRVALPLEEAYQNYIKALSA